VVDGPEVRPVRVGRQIANQQPDHRKDSEDPAVAAILALAWTQIPVSEQRHASQCEQDDHERNERFMGEEGHKPAPAKDGQAAVCRGQDKDEYHSDDRRHHSSLTAFCRVNAAPWASSA
jgi:hypothetical protein